MMDAQKNLYREEAYELLAVLEDALLELEQHPGNMEVVGKVFRAMHTIKGSGAMFGFDDIASFTHTIETVYDMIRNGRLQVGKDIISLTLKACDHIKTMLGTIQGEEKADEAKSHKLTEAFRKFLPQKEEETPGGMGKSLPEVASDRDAGEAGTTYRIRFKPHQDLFSNGTNPVPLLNELRGLGECSVICHLKGLPELQEMDPEGCYTGWDIILTTGSDANAIQDIFIFVEDTSDISIEPIGCILQDEDDLAYKKVGEILLERGDIREGDLEKALASQKKIGEVLVETGLVKRSQVASALREQEQVRGTRKKHLAGDETSSIRVPALKLDALVNLAGELVTVQARLSEFSARENDPDLMGIAEDVEHLSAELRDIAMGIRMLPLGTTFAKFKRLVRDLSSELGKEIGFITEGEETELDKTVIDKLSDPLVHLIRNSIDHGIEQPDKRIASGKPVQGFIRLTAEHAGAHVLISITDDGAGLDTGLIRAKAVEKGLIAADATLTEREIHKLIFAPGFSTSTNVTSVSGRGVGMDVVRSSIESLGGAVEVISAPARGTTITLKLPLTLAIIDGLLISLADESFVIPLAAVVECVDLTGADISRGHGRHLIKVRDEIVPYIHLREVFDTRGKRPEREQVVITDLAGKRVGFVVDKVIGEHQTVIKNLGHLFKATNGVSGATILGDGSVALILDIHKLIQQAEVDDAA